MGTVKHLPQISKDPFRFKDESRGKSYQIVSVDMVGNRSESEPLTV